MKIKSLWKNQKLENDMHKLLALSLALQYKLTEAEKIRKEISKLKLIDLRKK